MGGPHPQHLTASTEGTNDSEYSCPKTLQLIPLLQVDRTRQAVTAFRTGKLKSVGRNKPLARPPPDMPPRDQLNVVQPGKVAKRGKAGSVKSRIAILHALANIEQWA